MRAIPIFFAASETDDLLTQWHGLSASTKEHLIILTAIALITVPLVVWAMWFRKTRHRHHTHRHGHHHSDQSAKPIESVEADNRAEPSRKRKKRRRSGRVHRPRNPTLAETGGLPPVRTGDNPEILP